MGPSESPTRHCENQKDPLVFLGMVLLASDRRGHPLDLHLGQLLAAYFEQRLRARTPVQSEGAAENFTLF